MTGFGAARRLRAIYLCALSAIALLAIAAQIRVQQTLSRQDGAGHVINIAGGQRTLSQKSAKAALAAALARDAASRAAAMDEMTTALAKLQEVHNTLKSSDPAQGLRVTRPTRTAARFESLQPLVDALLAGGAALRNIPADEPLPPAALQRLLDAESAFLPEINRLVYQLDAELRDRQAAARLTESALMGMTLLVLLLIAVLIFEPATRMIRNQFVHGAQREAMLRRARDAAEAANRTKTEYLANMSHEIRTPMTSILGYAETLLDERLDPVQRREASGTIMRNAQHLLAVLNDILDVARMEAGKLMIERVRTRPAALIAEVVANMRARAVQKNLTLSTTYEGAIPETIVTDPTRLRQILMNLLSNAIKFTNQGGIELVVSIVERPTTCLRVAITDTGIGMTPDECLRVFDPFEQADATVTRLYGGTGLGLSIARRLAVELGGQIAVTSRPGLGSTFTVDVHAGDLTGVPMIEHYDQAEPIDGTSAPAPPPNMTGRVLLAEDGEDNHRLIRRLLERSGIEVTWVANGADAVTAALEQTAQRTPYDLILMDMQMPVMDGYAATKRLRAAGYHHPIVALTAHAMLGDRERCLQAGCDDYATKPIRRESFFRKLQRYLPAEAPAAGNLEEVSA